jgi:hypothetical protein
MCKNFAARAIVWVRLHKQTSDAITIAGDAAEAPMIRRLAAMLAPYSCGLLILQSDWGCPCCGQDDRFGIFPDICLWRGSQGLHVMCGAGAAASSPPSGLI